MWFLFLFTQDVVYGSVFILNIKNQLRAMGKINFDELENIEVDVIVGFGAACRVAAALQRNNLRVFANPFDWQMNYSLDTVIELLKNQGKTFYHACCGDKRFDSGSNTGIIAKNGMISMHDFPKNLPIEKAPAFFKKKYKHRFKNLNNQLNRAKKILILTNRNIDINDMENFIQAFSKLYQNKKIYYINIYDTQSKDEEYYEISIKENLTLLKYCFNDEHSNGRSKENNPDFWLGNVEYWDKILKKISLNKKFTNNNIFLKKIFNIKYDVSNVFNTHKIISIFGIKFKFKDKL